MNKQPSNPARKGRGSDTNNAGHFAARRKARAGIGLGGSGVPDLGHATTADLGRMLTSPDRHVRAQVAMSPHINEDMLRSMADPAEDEIVRFSVAGTGYPGTASRAAQDRSPFVRAVAAAHEYDLGQNDIDRLRADKEVQKVLAAVA